MKLIYSKDSKGSIRSWGIEQQQDKFRVVSGLLDGQKTTSEWTVCKPKNVGKANETTGEEQCVLEVEARYKKQLKTGYFEDINDVDNLHYVEPMLAKKYQDYQSKIDFSKREYVAQCKFNGIRATIQKNGARTRTGEEINTIPHILESLKPFFEQYPDAILDGELFNEEYREKLNEINKIVRRTVNISEEDLIMSKELIKFYCYDGYDFMNMGKETAYIDRKNLIDMFKFQYIEYVDTVEISSLEQFMDFYNKLIENHHEGAMLRLKKGGYENKRSKNLLKFKPTDDDEFIFVDAKEGTGNWSNMIKIITLTTCDKSKTFDATFKGTQEEARKFLNEYKDLIGSEVTIYFNGYTGLGTPNYAQFDYNNFKKK